MSGREAPSEPRRVPIGEVVLVEGAGSLSIHGLGSCVAVFLREVERGIAALAHVLLPAPQDGRVVDRPGRYAAPAVDAMLAAIVARGGDLGRIEAKIVGGAVMFPDPVGAEAVPIGARNVSAVREALRERGIRVASEDVGGAEGRTIVAEAATGAVRVRTLRRAERAI